MDISTSTQRTPYEPVSVMLTILCALAWNGA